MALPRFYRNVRSVIQSYRRAIRPAGANPVPFDASGLTPWSDISLGRVEELLARRRHANGRRLRADAVRLTSLRKQGRVGQRVSVRQSITARRRTALQPLGGWRHITRAIRSTSNDRTGSEQAGGREKRQLVRRDVEQRRRKPRWLESNDEPDDRSRADNDAGPKQKCAESTWSHDPSSKLESYARHRSSATGHRKPYR
jgi:hypothetical protein